MAIKPATMEKIETLGGAGLAGLINGFITKKSSVAGFVTTLATAAGGTIGAMFTKGAISEVLEGAAASGVGTFMFLVPMMFGSEAKAYAQMKARVGTAKYIGGPADRMRGAALESAGALKGVITGGVLATRSNPGYGAVPGLTPVPTEQELKRTVFIS